MSRFILSRNGIRDRNSVVDGVQELAGNPTTQLLEKTKNNRCFLMITMVMIFALDETPKFTIIQIKFVQKHPSIRCC